MNMQNPLTNLPLSPSPSPPSILLNRSRPSPAPETFINLGPSNISSLNNRETIQYASSPQMPSDVVFQTPVGSSNYRAYRAEDDPSVSVFSRGGAQGQETVVISGVERLSPPVSRHQEQPNLQHTPPSKPAVLPDSPLYLKTLLLQHQKTISLLKHELSVQTTIILQLETQALKIQPLSETNFVLASKLRELQKQQAMCHSTIQQLRQDKERLETASVERARTDQEVRVEIFAENQKLRKELREKERKEAGLVQKIEQYESQIKLTSLDKSFTATANTNTKFLLDIEHKEKQIIQLQQLIAQYEADTVKYELLKTQLHHKLTSHEHTISLLQNQLVSTSSSLKQKSHQSTTIHSLQLETDSLKKTLLATQSHLITQTEKNNLMLTAKEEQLSKLRAMLDTQELKFQQVSSRGSEGSKLLLKEIEELKDVVYKREVVIGNVQQSLIERERELGVVEIEKGRLEGRLRLMSAERESELTEMESRWREAEARSVELTSKVKTLETHLTKIQMTRQADSSNTVLEERIQDLTVALEENRKETFDNKRLYEQRIFSMESAGNELEIKIRQLALLNDQKEAEKQHFEAQSKTLYNNYLELRREIVEGEAAIEENKLLKQRLAIFEQEAREKGVSYKSSRSNPSHAEPHYPNPKAHPSDPSHLIHSLRHQNNVLRVSLEQATSKIDQYSSAANQLEDLRGKILQFQIRAERFLGNGRAHQYYSSDQEHRVMLDEVVQEMSKKLKKFKKENKELKKQVRGRGDEQGERRNNHRRQPQSQHQYQTKLKQIKQLQQRNQQNELSHKQQLQSLLVSFQSQRQTSKSKQHQRISQLKQKMLQVNAFKDQQHSTQLTTLLSQNTRLQLLTQQYQSRIKSYQSLFLQFKNKQTRANQQTAHIQEQKNHQHQQQMFQNAEDFTQVEEKALFFRQKNEELEMRVGKLLEINVGLTAKLEEQAEMLAGVETGKLYRHQIGILEENVRGLEGKLERVVGENMRLKEQEAMMISAGESGEGGIERIRVQQLTYEVSRLQVALAEAEEKRNESVLERRRQQYEESSSLQLRINQLEHIIDKYEHQKSNLISQNQLMTHKLNSVAQPQTLLNKISLLQHQIQRLQQLNYKLNLSLSSSPAPSHPLHAHHQQQTILQSYHHVLNQVDKLLQRVDLVRTYTIDLVNLISESEESEFVSELEMNLRKIVEFLEDVDAIRNTIGGIKRQQERQMLRGEASIYFEDS